MFDEQEHLAALAQYKTRTQADYYRVHDKESETDLGRRAVTKLVSLLRRNRFRTAMHQCN